jgi:hypothetical protein
MIKISSAENCAGIAVRQGLEHSYIALLDDGDVRSGKRNKWSVLCEVLPKGWTVKVVKESGLCSN